MSMEEKREIVPICCVGSTIREMASKYGTTTLRHYRGSGGLCDIDRYGPDQAQILSRAIQEKDPKMKRAFTPERASIICDMTSIREKGEIPDVIQYIDNHKTERYRNRINGRFVSEKIAIQILTEQLI